MSLLELKDRIAGRVALIFVLCSSTTLAQETVGTLRGVVRNETGRAVEYALVALDPSGARRETRTDRDGRFSFRGTSGQHVLRVTFIGYRPHERTVDVQRGAVDVEVTLERAITTLAGVDITAQRRGLFGSVIARDSLLPVPNARIEVLGARTADTTATDGTFNFPTLKPGAYIVRVRHTQFESRNISIVVPEKGSTQLDLVVERGILSRDAHMEQLYRELDSRVQWQGTSAALISREDLKGLPTTGLDASIISAPGFLKANFYPAREGWENACLYVDGIARPAMTIMDFAIEDIEAVEIYGPPLNRSDPTGSLTSRWPTNAMCGMSSGPRVAFDAGRLAGAPRLSGSAIRAQFIVIWLRQR